MAARWSGVTFCSRWDALEFCRHDFHPFLLKEFLYVAELVERAGDEPFFLFGLEFGLEVHKVELEFLL